MIIPEIILRMSSEGLCQPTDLRPYPTGAARPTHPVIIEGTFKCPSSTALPPSLLFSGILMWTNVIQELLQWPLQRAWDRFPHARDQLIQPEFCLP
jgi:hypothetical protein